MAFFYIGIFSCTVQADEEDIENAKDHPVFSRMPNFFINEYQSNFDAFPFPVSPEKAEEMEGQKTFIEYRLKEDANAPSQRQILKNYSNAVKQLGGMVVYEGPYEEEDVYYDRVMTAKLVSDEKEIWIMAAPDVTGEIYLLAIIERGEMAQDVTATGMLQALNRDGRVTLYIHFDTGKSDIKTESKEIIDEITVMLRNTPALRLTVEGHTDNVGDDAANKALSERRAASVVQALIAGGIDPSRLNAVGFGATRPIADNATEEGRSQNRRVEMVRR